jgi:hypothetical protein
MALAVTAGVAIFFTVLLAAHVIAYASRAARLSSTLVPVLDPESPKPTPASGLARRAFLSKAIGAAMAATAASFLGPRVITGHWSSIAFAADGDCQMVEVEANGDAGVFGIACQGECPPLLQEGAGGALVPVPGECKLVAQLVTNSDGQAFARYRCVCVYAVESNCKAVKKGKFKYACEGECPTLYSMGARGKRQKVPGQCIPVIEQEGGLVRIRCICIYG